ncbi:SMC family ATPase [Kitasatospora acidiphila]|uniref:Nuclease SbcCD subunit C n=1 Tax=Kitasatospora acidiphila TaxID=2567942 RepID=A0A540VZT8_9ACTN|nr:SMC family ATPase [Kitasatospora acidiphila]TQF02285.1 SMC family ATPase [Kitasatospora acidiphila]
MRLHQLTVTAFGPFAGRERVDFDTLTTGGLFLLRGATGAGKSSLLDAVCYALYGELPGARRANRMRSDHADPGVLTEVRLEVTLGGRRLEITRIPEQPRPKKRGTGFTVEKAQTLLREWAADADDGTPGWRAASRSHQEAGEELLRLIGMSREQFCQVVLLPQGDFARFLRADASQRAELLGRLFDTERFRQLETWLGDRRRDQEAAVQADRHRLRELISRTEQAAGEPWPTEAAPEEALGWAAVLRESAAQALAVRTAALTAAERHHVDAQGELAEQQELAHRQAEHTEAVKHAERLAATADQEAAARERLALAQAALTVESALRQHTQAATAHDRARNTEAQARAQLTRAWDQSQPAGTPAGAPSTPRTEAHAEATTYPSDPSNTQAPQQPTTPAPTTAHVAATPLPHAPADRLAAAEAATREELGRLEAAAADERRAAALAAEQQREAAERRRAEELAEEAERWLAEQQDAAEAGHQREEAARATALRAEQLAAQRTEAEQRAQAAHRRDELRARITHDEHALLPIRQAALAAREHSLDLRQRRLDGMAAELAGRLGPDQACPVCGSAEHPALAVAPTAPVGAADEEAAAAAQQAAEDARAAAERALTELRLREAAATATAGEQSVGELAAHLAELTEQHRSALRAGEELTVLLQQREQLEQRHQHYTEQLRQARERVVARTTGLEQRAAEQAELAARIAAARGDAPSVAARAARLSRLAEALSAAAQAARATEQAAARLRDAEQELSRTATTAGFASPRQAAGAALPPTELTALRHRLEQRAAERRSVDQALARPELAAAAGAPPADPGAAQATLNAATAALRAAAAAEHAARQRVEALRELGHGLAELSRKAAPRLAEFGEISRLAQLAGGTSGENRLKMRLESYVLAARLEQVAAAASARLVRMSGGRYTLVHSDERSAGGKRSGLSLLVVDSWTGTERDTATLSGGESFFASLALALGLADVVTDEAGGMPLDTLFIDEGFGTLDEQALEEVMDVLDGLRERDRAVGIVSHVADLRQRIPSQLLVHKTRCGSTLRPTTADAP